MSNFDLMEENEVSIHSKGGTELIKHKLYDGRIPRELLEQFQIIFSRPRTLDENKFRIFFAHDLPGDPESDILKNEGWRKFHKIVFVSNWQMQNYIAFYGIPWSHCMVIKHAIDAIPLVEKPKDKIRLIYTPTPHRGLNILVPVFDKLCEKYDNLELDVYSSFKLYGFDERDKQYQRLFETCDAHPKINNHGTVSNEEIRAALQKAHIFAYPSIWQETFCLCLLEAMSAGCIAVHSNLGCLYETAGNWTYMYQYSEDMNQHASIFYSVLDKAIEDIRENPDYLSNMIAGQKTYVDMFHNWDDRVNTWSALMGSIIASNPSKKIYEKNTHFVYNTL